MSNTIQIVLGLHDPRGTYCRHAGVLLTSLFGHTASPVHVSILHDSTLTEDNRARLRRTGERYGQTIDLIDVSDRISRMGDDIGKLTGDFTPGTLFRLLIPDLISSAKVIYLDCDVVVRLDIALLWNIPIDDVSLAGVPDSEAEPRRRKKLRNRIRCRLMRYDAQNYFNAGVLSMNLERIRERHDLLQEAAHFFRRFRHALTYPDQDFLNATFRDDVRLIDDRFNWYRAALREGDVIVHLMGSFKPWKFHRCTPRDRLYWDTFAESEWRDQLVAAMFETYKNHPFAHCHSADCARRLLSGWKRKLLVDNPTVRVCKNLRILLAELRYRMSGDSRR